MRVTKGVGLAGVGLLLSAWACARKPVEVNPIVPSFTIDRPTVPLGSVVEATYTWALDPQARPLRGEHAAFVHFLDSKGHLLFDDDHVPIPPPAGWQPGKTYRYSRLLFFPVYPQTGRLEVRVGLYPRDGTSRVALKGDDNGMREYRVGAVGLVPGVDNLTVTYKRGWHEAEVDPRSPGVERAWTTKEAVAAFQNPKKDVVVFLQADTNMKGFPRPPVLTISVGGWGHVAPIEDSDVWARAIRFRGEALGEGETADLHLAMDQTFVPVQLGIGRDQRELALHVGRIWVVEAERLSPLPAGVVDATPLTAAAPERAPAEVKPRR